MEINQLKSQLQASNTERDRLKAIVETFNGAALPSHDVEDDEDDEMDMEGGSSSGGAVVEQFRFPSTGETVVKLRGARDEDARLFTAEEGEEMAQYIESLTRAGVPRRQAAAVDPAMDFENLMEQSLDLARQFSAECKNLTAKCAALEKKTKRPPSKAVEVLEVVFGFGFCDVF